jgi:hypothetical protein
MQVVAWLRYILQCLNAIVQGVEVTANNWPTSRPGSNSYGKSSIKDTAVDFRAGEQKPV